MLCIIGKFGPILSEETHINNNKKIFDTYDGTDEKFSCVHF